MESHPVTAYRRTAPSSAHLFAGIKSVCACTNSSFHVLCLFLRPVFQKMNDQILFLVGSKILWKVFVDFSHCERQFFFLVWFFSLHCFLYILSCQLAIMTSLFEFLALSKWWCSLIIDDCIRKIILFRLRQKRQLHSWIESNPDFAFVPAIHHFL